MDQCHSKANNPAVKTPDRTTAAAFPRYSSGVVVADSAALQWSGLYARRFRFARVVDRFLVPATAEPLISCVIRGSGEFQEREINGPWQTRKLQRGDIFITRASAPYEIRCKSPAGEELDFIVLHLELDRYLAALAAVHPGKTDEVEIIDFLAAMKRSLTCVLPVPSCWRQKCAETPPALHL